MSTRSKIGIVTVATIIGAVCGFFGGILFMRSGGSSDIGWIPMWFGFFVVLAPVSGGFFSFISGLISLRQTERTSIIYVVSAVIGFLAGYLVNLPFDYMSM